MKAKVRNLQGLFNPDTNLQYSIPLFQRHYVWEKDKQWAPLWDDIKQELSQASDKSTEHFTGTVVIGNHRIHAGDMPIYDIIDGQQRFTTFQIILCIIRDICKSRGHDDLVSEVNGYIYNRDNQGNLLQGDEKYKLILSSRDRNSFKSVLDGRAKESRGKIFSAYSYFFTEIMAYLIKEIAGCSQKDLEKIRNLFDTILQQFNFVQILADGKDKPEKIFESLNARGKKLFEFDLLKNNLFLRALEDGESLYKKFWEHFENEYWDPEEKKKGTSSELFLQHFLMTKLGQEGVKPEFYVYERQYLRQPELAEVTIENEFSELKRYSEIYQDMVDCNEDSEVGQRMRFYKTFDLTVLHPFVLFVKCEVGIEGFELERIFDILESYTIRRMLCFKGKAGLKRFNIFFSKLIRNLKGNFSLDGFIEKMSDETSDTTKYPADSEIRPALHTRFDLLPFSDEADIVFPGNRFVKAALEGHWVNTAGVVKQKLIRYILYRIELKKMEEDKYAERLSFEDKFTTLEHIMPKEWKNSWDLPVEAKSVIYDVTTGGVYVDRSVESKNKYYNDLFSAQGTQIPSDLPNESYEAVYRLAKARDFYLQSIGNLTLVKRELNSKLGNKRFPEKKKALSDHSVLKLNREICQQEAWDVNEIHERAEKLIEDFCKIWPSLEWFKGK